MTKEINIDRRTFTKGMGLVGGGILLSGPLSAFSTMPGPFKGTLKLAVIGCGGRGTGAVQQALTADPDTELVAMADAFPDRLESCHATLTKIFGEKRIKVSEKDRYVGFASYKDAIDKADVVILTTPPGWRPAHFEYAVSRGKHVFMEKPVATDGPGVRRVLDAAKIAKEKNLNVVVGLQRHYQANYRKLHGMLREGAAGDIVSGQVYWNSGGVWVKDRQAEWTEMEYQMRNWYYFNWLCGDHILEQHIHNIDVANWFVGGYPISAQGMGGRETRTDNKYGQIFDHHFVEYTYASGAVIASQCRHQTGTMNRVSEIFQGTKANLNLDGGGKGIITSRSGQALYTHDSSEDDNPYQVEHNELFASIRAGKVINDAENGAYSTLTAIMGRMATYTGQVITWDQALNSQEILVPEESGLTWKSNPPVLPLPDGSYPIPVPGKTKIS